MPRNQRLICRCLTRTGCSYRHRPAFHPLHRAAVLQAKGTTEAVQQAEEVQEV